jgi:uncharacterized protein YjbI with pentapeptide repeats
LRRTLRERLVTETGNEGNDRHQNNDLDEAKTALATIVLAKAALSKAVLAKVALSKAMLAKAALSKAVLAQRRGAPRRALQIGHR